jgi:hypothetical protein
MNDPPRLLHKHSEHGYTQHTHEALTDEPEAVNAETQRRLTHEADLRQTQRQRQLWQDIRPQLLNDLEQLHHHFGTLVTNELRAIRRELDRIERRLAS